MVVIKELVQTAILPRNLVQIFFFFPRMHTLKLLDKYEGVWAYILLKNSGMPTSMMRKRTI